MKYNIPLIVWAITAHITVAWANPPSSPEVVRMKREQVVKMCEWLDPNAHIPISGWKLINCVEYFAVTPAPVFPASAASAPAVASASVARRSALPASASSSPRTSSAALPASAPASGASAKWVPVSVPVSSWLPDPSASTSGHLSDKDIANAMRRWLRFPEWVLPAAGGVALLWLFGVVGLSIWRRKQDWEARERSYPVQSRVTSWNPDSVAYWSADFNYIKQPPITLEDNDPERSGEAISLDDEIALFWTLIEEGSIDNAELVLNEGILKRNQDELTETRLLAIANYCYALAKAYSSSAQPEGIRPKIADIRDTVNVLPDFQEKDWILIDINELIPSVQEWGSMEHPLVPVDLSWSIASFWTENIPEYIFAIRIFTELVPLVAAGSHWDAYKKIVRNIGTFSDRTVAVIIWLKLLEVVNRWRNEKSSKWEGGSFRLILEHLHIERALMRVVSEIESDQWKVPPSKLYPYMLLLEKVDYDNLHPSWKKYYDQVHRNIFIKIGEYLYDEYLSGHSLNEIQLRALQEYLKAQLVSENRNKLEWADFITRLCTLVWLEKGVVDTYISILKAQQWTEHDSDPQLVEARIVLEKIQSGVGEFGKNVSEMFQIFNINRPA